MVGWPGPIQPYPEPTGAIGEERPVIRLSTPVIPVGAQILSDPPNARQGGLGPGGIGQRAKIGWGSV